MIRTSLILFSIICANCFLHSQNLTTDWKKLSAIQINAISCWNIDAFQNILVAEESSISKYNSEFQLIYHVNDKSNGPIKQIIPITPLKIVVFSEQQQQICFLDNTLTAVDQCIDLTDYQIELANYIGRSSRGDKLWIYDQINSTILLIDLNQKGKIIQEIQNSKGLISLGEISELIEYESKLYILDSKNQLTIFDIYGNFISQDNVGFSHMSSSDNKLWFEDKHELFLWSENEIPERIIDCPINEFNLFRNFSSRFYFQTKNEIQIFEMVKKK